MGMDWTSHALQGAGQEEVRDDRKSDHTARKKRSKDFVPFLLFPIIRREATGVEW